MTKLSLLPLWRQAVQDAVALIVSLAGLMAVCRILPTSHSVIAAYLLLPGMLLIIGLFAGRLAIKCQLPSMTGSICVGIVCSPYVFPGVFVHNDFVNRTDLIRHVALGIIAFMAGTAIRLPWLKERFASIASIVIAQICIIPLIMVPVLVAMQHQLSVFQLAQQSHGIPVALIAALLACVCLATSPVAIMSVVKERRATGPLVETAIGASVCKDILVVFGFTLCIGLITAASQSNPSDDIITNSNNVSNVIMSALGQAGAYVGLSVLIGIGIGMGVAWLAERNQKRLSWVVLSSAFLAALLATLIDCDPLWCLLAAGFASVNIYPKRTVDGEHRIAQALHILSLPTFITFFIIIGLEFHYDILRHYWYLVCTLIVVRLLALYGSVWVGTRLLPSSVEVRQWVWTAMVPQAGFSLALATIIGEQGAWGRVLMTILIAVIVIHACIGSVLFTIGMKRASLPDQYRQVVS